MQNRTEPTKLERDMTGAEIRPTVVDFLVDRARDPAPLTPQEDALMASATPAEHQAAAAIENAGFVGYSRFIAGEATEEEEALWRMMPDLPVWEDLPLSAASVLTAMDCHWPYSEGMRRTLQRWTANWTAEDKRRFEHRFTGWLERGIHWD
jgi:hypothetical protein